MICNIIYQNCHHHHSDQLGHVHGHFINLRRIVLLDVSQDLEVLVLDEVDSHTLPSKTTASTDAVNVELAIGGKVVVDDQGDLLDIQAAAPKVSGDEDP